MAKQRDDFVEGARKQGVSQKKAARIFELMEYFAGYGFNKSHSTAYALLAYQTAYLKANYPWHFTAALLTIEAQNTDKLAAYMAESRDRGVPMLAPDINQSELRFTVEAGRGVRFGLTAIKGLGDGAINAILEVRRTLNGCIRSLQALCELLDLRLVNKRVLEALVKSGACDSLAGSPGLQGRPLREVRARLLASIDPACEHGSRTQRDKDLGQAQLFGGDHTDAGGNEHHGATPEATPWTEMEQLQFEKEALGLYWSGHPIDRYSEDLREYGARSTSVLALKKDAAEGEEAGFTEAGQAAPNGSGRIAEDITIGGIVTSIRPLKTRKGDRMCVFMLEDAGGSLEVVVFPDAFRQYGNLAESGKMVLVKGRFERDDESARLLAAEILPIELVRERLAKLVAIRLSTPPHDKATFERLWDVLSHHRGDRRVAFDLDLQDAQPRLRVRVDVHGQIRVRPSEQFVSEVERICGTGSVSLR
jgi:DNA polymerase-3 subunit alpha